MIEVQVRGEHDVDASAASPADASAWSRCAVAIDGVDVALLRVHLVADAAVDEHPAPVGLDEQRAHRQRMRLRSSGGDCDAHSGFGHDAEHRAAVEPEEPVVNADQPRDRPNGSRWR